MPEGGKREFVNQHVRESETDKQKICAQERKGY